MKKEKIKILDDYFKAIRAHRKEVILLLNRSSPMSRKKRNGDRGCTGIESLRRSRRYRKNWGVFVQNGWSRFSQYLSTCYTSVKTAKQLLNRYYQLWILLMEESIDL
ncbi:hypothetical protein ACFLUG_01105 [Chloroflexota bacterium]